MSIKAIFAALLLAVSLGACASVDSAGRKTDSVYEGYRPTRSDFRDKH